MRMVVPMCDPCKIKSSSTNSTRRERGQEPPVNAGGEHSSRALEGRLSFTDRQESKFDVFDSPSTKPSPFIVVSTINRELPFFPRVVSIFSPDRNCDALFPFRAKSNNSPHCPEK